MALHIAKKEGKDTLEEVENLKAELALANEAKIEAEKGKTDAETALKKLQESIDAAQESAKPIVKAKVAAKVK